MQMEIEPSGRGHGPVAGDADGEGDTLSPNAAEVRAYIAGLRRIKLDCITALSVLVRQRDGGGLPTREARYAAARLLGVIAHEERRLDRAGVLGRR